MTMTTIAEFLASLPAAFDLRAPGSGRAELANVLDAIRRDLKLAVTAGLIPASAKFSVRKVDHNSIMVMLTEWHGDVLHPSYHAILLQHMSTRVRNGQRADLKVSEEWTASPASERFHWESRWANVASVGASGDNRLTDEINVVLVLADLIAERHNYRDEYDRVGYCVTVHGRVLCAHAERGLMLETDPVFATLVSDARIAAGRLGPKATRALCGSGGVDGCDEWHLRRLVDLDCLADGRPVFYMKSTRQWCVVPLDPNGNVIPGPEGQAPLCLRSMGCLCAAHARGLASAAPCNASEPPEPPKRPAIFVTMGRTGSPVASRGAS